MVWYRVRIFANQCHDIVSGLILYILEKLWFDYVCAE